MGEITDWLRKAGIALFGSTGVAILADGFGLTSRPLQVFAGVLLLIIAGLMIRRPPRMIAVPTIAAPLSAQSRIEAQSDEAWDFPPPMIAAPAAPEPTASEPRAEAQWGEAWGLSPSMPPATPLTMPPATPFAMPSASAAPAAAGVRGEVEWDDAWGRNPLDDLTGSPGAYSRARRE
jgi:hypothetical protein